MSKPGEFADFKEMQSLHFEEITKRTIDTVKESEKVLSLTLDIHDCNGCEMSAIHRRQKK